MKKYAPLYQYLVTSGKESVKIRFRALEDILGFPLPGSARAYRAWWSNDKTHVQAEDGWLACGWRVTQVNLEDTAVTFTKQNTSTQLDKLENYQNKENSFTPNSTVLASPGIAFELIAQKVMSDYFATPLRHRKKENWGKMFDLVSDDYAIVGDAKYLTMVKGEKLPPAKFSNIAEHVWMLEKTKAQIQFLVFGNDKRVPQEWLKRYGNLVSSVLFYFIEVNGDIMELNKR